MDSQSSTPTVIYTMESIARLREEKKAEVRTSRERIQELAEDLFAPQQSKSKMDNLLQHVNAGIAAYDGIRTGIMVLQRIRGFFRKRKKR